MSEKGEHWVDTEGFGRCRLDGNAHTFPGRISAWSETLGMVTISSSDVRDASAQARAWIEGFLAGNEPEFHEFLGIQPADADMVPDEDPTQARYGAALASFHASGSWPFAIQPRPTLAPPPNLTPTPWVAAGGEVFGWNGTEWAPLDPQPELHFGLPEGTVCDQRGCHELDVVGDRHTFCGGCGELTQSSE